jgi:hypothetical protein
MSNQTTLRRSIRAPMPRNLDLDSAFWRQVRHPPRRSPRVKAEPLGVGSPGSCGSGASVSPGD